MMSRENILLLFLGVAIGTSLTGSLIPADSSIPPTRAFSKVIMAGQDIEAGSYSDELEIVIQGAMTASVNDNTITIKLKQESCPASQGITGVDENGDWVCGLL